MKGLTDRQARLLGQSAQRFMDGWGIDFAQYEAPVVTLDEFGISADVEWTHKGSGQGLALTAIWFDRATGKINQAGSNYGRLTL